LDNKMHDKRIKLTIDVLKQLKQAGNNIIWLNPVVESGRWNGTSARYIELFCKMIPFTFEALEDSIKQLVK